MCTCMHAFVATRAYTRLGAVLGPLAMHDLLALGKRLAGQGGEAAASAVLTLHVKHVLGLRCLARRPRADVLHWPPTAAQ